MNKNTAAQLFAHTLTAAIAIGSTAWMTHKDDWQGQVVTASAFTVVNEQGEAVAIFGHQNGMTRLYMQDSSDASFAVSLFADRERTSIAIVDKEQDELVALSRGDNQHGLSVASPDGRTLAAELTSNGLSWWGAFRPGDQPPAQAGARPDESANRSNEHQADATKE